MLMQIVVIDTRLFHAEEFANLEESVRAGRSQVRAAQLDDPAGAQKAVQGIASHLNDACIGTISEIFDADQPFTPRGCIAQAWSVAEALRCWAKTAD